MYIHINCVSKRNTCNFTCSWLLRKKNVKEIYLIYQCICIYYTASMLKTNGLRTKVLCRLLPWNHNFEVSD